MGSAMDSTTLIVVLSVLFAVVGVGSTVIYYFARYWIKTDADDKELLTQKPISIGAEPAVKAAPKPKQVRAALESTRETLWGRLSRLTFVGELKPQLRNEIEEILYTSDLGPNTAEFFLSRLDQDLSRAEKNNADHVRSALRSEMQNIFQETAAKDLWARVEGEKKSAVWMIVGVNGAGKTTTLGKLASLAKSKNLKTLIVAGDTFRAAADSQLKVWAERAGSEIFNPENIKDPSAVAYSGLERAKAVGAELVLIDTAGRLHTQDHLMQELQKMKRVMSKIYPEAPHETLLVIDANAGQNALVQARQFHEAVGLTGVIITKMDGSAKGGVALGIVHELKIPVVYIGIGEAIEDLRPFNASEFIEAII
jgi:fused signal recognition particle receptor